MRKCGIPLRPVISMIGTPQYGLAKYLDSVIKPYIFSSCMTSSSTEFVEAMKGLTLPSSCKLVSFDVVSLFTNVPLEETINLACDYVYNQDNSIRPNFERKHFKKLLQYATSGEFLYKSSLYRQVDGVSMGSPLGPTLANLFLANLEKKWCESSYFPLAYFKYVDDVFCVYDANQYDGESFLDYLNSQHPNLKFTSESKLSTLPFLDVSVNIEAGIANFSVFRKETYSGLLQNFYSSCPMAWKKGLILCFLHRAYRICSSWALFHEEVEKLRKIFLRNAYPIAFFKNILHRFINCKYRMSDTRSDVESDYFTLVLPYFGQTSELLKKRLTRLARRYKVNCRVVFSCFKISQYFSLKDVVPDYLQSCVVYKYCCSVDPKQVYIGRTKRHLIVRIREHASPNTNSAIFNHRLSCTCSYSMSNFSILKHCNTDYDLSIAEALSIKKEKPSLNSTLANNRQSIFLSLY